MYAENELKFALNIAEDGRILSATFPQYASADAKMVVGLPEGNITDYLYHDVIEEGEIVGYYYDYAPLPKPEEDNTPTAQEDTDAMLVDHELRISLLELFSEV